MTLHVMNDLIQGSDQWLEQRRGIVTASVVGRLITQRTRGAIEYGCPACDATVNNPCRSKKTGEPIKTLHPERAAVAREAAAVMLEVADDIESRSLTLLLVAERITGYVEPTYVSDDMLRGIDDEPRAAAKYSDHYAPVTTTGFMIRDDTGHRIGYSPDGLVGDDGLIEVKSYRQKKHLQTILAGDVPSEHMAQLQAGLLVSGRAWIDYVSYCGGMPMYVKRVYPNEQWHDAITAAVAQFETAATAMTAAYTEATKGLATTERAVELEMVI